ncbi:MAG: hypothetical protein Q9207_004443 [Kuettlingeria erythrocarpa]
MERLARADDHERKAKIEKHKDDQLKKQQDGKGHWKKELASNSESAVKADRDEVPDVDEDISKLQEQTARMGQEEVKK